MQSEAAPAPLPAPERPRPETGPTWQAVVVLFCGAFLCLLAAPAGLVYGWALSLDPTWPTVFGVGLWGATVVAFALVALFLAVASAIVGIGMLARAKWARFSAAGLGVVYVLVGLVPIGALLLFFLRRQAVGR